MGSPWQIPVMWKDSKIFIIGGGASLSDMDWPSFLSAKKEKGFKVIGCNDAYTLGEDIIDICFFGDSNWYHEHNKNGLSKFNGMLVTNDEWEMSLMDDDRMRVCKRDPLAMKYEYKDRLGWYYNTGITAIELAIRLGGKKIVLLGFDMCLGKDEEGNWYENIVNAPNADRFIKFKRGANILHSMIVRTCPDVEIYNANLNSQLENFPKIPRAEAVNI